PFIRYRTGDMAMLSDKPGHPLLPGYPAVERIEGRLQEFIVCRDRRLVSICTMGAAHFDELSHVDYIQYEQYEVGHVVLKVVSRKQLDEEVRRKIVRAIEKQTQLGCTAEIHEVDEIPRTANGKHRMLIQHLDVSTYLGGATHA
ncbi:MAG TPA: hypothetical protein VFW00_13100, partial [Rhodocyclaceae bacterium]|nr:hypothetical protein [Rhodocyclaceae bacterium]